ncbi:MAG: ester cyclase [Dehalococcoidia bacterium]
MGEQELINLVREQMDAFNNGDWDRWSSFLADDPVYVETGTGRTLRGRDQILGAVQQWKQSFADARGEIEQIFADGNDRVAAEIRWEGTHTGDLVGPSGTIPATNRKVHVFAAQLFTIQGDKVRETHHHLDLIGLLQQLEAVPQARAA